MFSALKDFQSELVAALRSDAALTAALGSSNIFDGAPKATEPPYIVIERLDAREIDGQMIKLLRVEIEWAIWLNQMHRNNGFTIAKTLDEALKTTTPASANFKLISYLSKRTQSRIDRKTGWTKIVLSSVFSIEDLT